jgi:hypothetical protein
MVRSCFACLPVALLGLAGCLEDDAKSRVQNVPVATPANLPPGSQAAATQVYAVGANILAANKDIGVQPVFSTCGRSDLGLAHLGTQQIWISDGLVAKCKTDGELAAVLCSELGRMVSEARVQLRTNGPDREPTLAPAVGGDPLAAADRTALAEQAMYEKQNPHPSRNRDLTPPPDPNELAKQFLFNAKYSADDLRRVSMLLGQARANPQFDKALAPSNPSASNWP